MVRNSEVAGLSLVLTSKTGADSRKTLVQLISHACK